MKNTPKTATPCSPVFKSSHGERAVLAAYDRALGQWPVAQEQLFVPTRHGKTFIIASGEKGAAPLILLHGAGSNSLMWIDDITEYSRYYRVYAVDLLGEAGKSAANRPDWHGPAYREWLAEVYAGLGIRRAAIIGISQGGWTALKFATERPAQVDKLVLICPGGIVADRVVFILYALLLTKLGPWGIRRLIRMLFGEHPVPEPVLESMALTVQHFRHRLEIPPRFSDEELAALTMPVHFIGGTKDVLRDTGKIAERLRPLVPHLTVELIDGGGHALGDTVSSTLPFLLADRMSDMRN